MATIHPLAVVNSDAQIEADVSIGAFCVVEPGAVIGRGCRLDHHSVVKSGVELGEDNHVHEHAVLGGLPQHKEQWPAHGALQIGRGNAIREFVTLHRSLEPQSATIVGDGNFLMSGSHVAHDCRIGDNTVIVNNVMLAGHVSVDDGAILSGAAGVHQFCRIGRLAMIGGQARITKDVPPFMLVDGESGLIAGLNLIGLRRAGFSRDEVAQLKQAFRLIYRSGIPWAEVLTRLPLEFPHGPAAELGRFFTGGKRGFTPARRMPATVKLHLNQDGHEQDGQREERKAG